MGKGSFFATSAAIDKARQQSASSAEQSASSAAASAAAAAASAASIERLLAQNAAPVTPTSAVDAYRDKRLASGYADRVTGKTYQCDLASLTFLTAIGASAQSQLASIPSQTFNIIASDNSEISLDAASAYALTNGRILPWVSATMLYARTLKNNILAGNPPADITQGWP